MSVLKGFRTYELSLQLYRGCQGIRAPYHLKDQLSRAALSAVLNTAEGSAKPTDKERRRFYSIALASVREVQALLEILESTQPIQPELLSVSGQAGACLYRLVHPR